MYISMEETCNEKKLEIQALTKVGHEYLSNESPGEASETFFEACQIAKRLDDYTLRGCSFNLGASYIANGKAKIGLRYLKQAIPPDDVNDGQENFADLWYNIGVARHALNDIDNAIVAYEKSHVAYKNMGTNKLEAECLSKLAVCYHLKQKLKDSCEMYQKAQEIYKNLGDKSNEALCLVSETGVLSQMGNIDECARKLDVLLDVCQEIEDRLLQAKIYHDIGLLYISEKLYESAAECLEQSLSCIENNHGIQDKYLQATVLQNIGAVCNYLKIYERAIYFHTSSADAYGEIGDRKSQTEVFNNLAYAYTQIGNYADAIIAFQHAIQAAKDTGDKESQCLATEGIAAIKFRLKQYKQAVVCYKEAMRLILLTSDQDNSHAERIVEKLVDAIQNQLSEDGKIVERDIAVKLAHKAKDNSRKGKSRFSIDEHNRKLVARGFEDYNNVEDSSEQDSDESSEESVKVLDSTDGNKPTNNGNNQNEVNYSKVSKNDKASILNPDDNKDTDNNNVSNNIMPTNYYEQPVVEIPRADKEFYMASIAQENLQKNPPPSVKKSSKTCNVM